MIKKRLIQVFLLMLLFITACNRPHPFVQITKDLKWVCFEAGNSALLWQENIIVGPGSLTLKFGEKYAWVICHKNDVHLFFIVDLKTGNLIKNPQMKDVIFKYKIKFDINDSYNETEIFGDNKTRLLVERLQEDIKQIQLQ